MALAVDNTTSKLNDASSATTVVILHTSSGTDRAITVQVPRSRSVTCSVTCDGTPMVSGGLVSNGAARAEIFGLIGQAAGVNTVVVTYSAPNGFYTATAISYTGANQSDLFGASDTQVGTGTAKSLSITTEADGSLLVDCVGSIGTVHTPGAGQTEVSAAANRVSSYKSAPTAGTNGTSWTGTTSSAYAYALVEIKAAVSTDTAIEDTRHRHTSESPALIQQHAPVVPDTQHGHLSAAPALIQQHTAAVQGTRHSHTAAAPAAIQQHAGSVESTRHRHTSGTPALTQNHQAAVDGTRHPQTAGSPAAIQQHQAAIEGARHGQTAEAPALTQQHSGSIAAAAHRHTSGSPALIQQHSPAIEGLRHPHRSGSPSVTESTPVAVRSTRHRHASGSPALIQQHAPTSSSTRHRHLAAVAALIQQHAVVIPGTRHPHRAGSPALVIPSALAAHFARGYTIPRMRAEVSIEGRQAAFARTTPRHLATVETEP